MPPHLRVQTSLGEEREGSWGWGGVQDQVSSELPGETGIKVLKLQIGKQTQGASVTGSGPLSWKATLLRFKPKPGRL